MLLFVAFINTSFSQTNPSKIISPELKSVRDVFERRNFDKTLWNLHYLDDSDKYLPIKAENVIIDIDKYLSVPPIENTRAGEMKEFKLIKKYRNTLDSTLNSLKLFSRGQRGEFLYIKQGSNPIHFASFNDTALSLIISGAYIGIIYNTLKLTSRQRAAKVITTYILPSLTSFANNFKTNEVKYFGMTFLYGSKNFLEEGSLATKPEFVGFVASSFLIKRYASGIITEDELINASDIYICDRDMFENKKIKIVLE